MEYLISAVWIGLELFSSIFFNSAFLEQKESCKFRILSIALAWIIIAIYSNFGINRLIKQGVTIFIFASISYILYEGSLIAHFLLTLICYIFIVTIDMIAVDGMCALLGISYNMLIQKHLTYIIVTTADKLLTTLFVWLLSRFRKKGNVGGIHNKWLFLSIFFPAVSATMLVVLFYNSPKDKDVSISIVVFSAILAIANFAILYIIDAMEKATAHEQDIRLLKQQIALQIRNYELLRKNYSAQRKATHEFERHIQTLRDLLDREEYSATQKYIRQLLNSRALHLFNICSNNPVMDVVLNQKYQIAQEHEIKMRVQVNDLSSVTISSDKLVVLLSNLLDNAIEACLKVDSHREIVCSILTDNGVYIAIRNTSLEVTMLDGEILTSKPNAEEHGYGLPAVKYILEQLGAEYAFAYSDGWFQFVAEIPL